MDAVCLSEALVSAYKSALGQNSDDWLNISRLLNDAI